jgi:hypothetical protein
MVGLIALDTEVSDVANKRVSRLALAAAASIRMVCVFGRVADAQRVRQQHPSTTTIIRSTS